MAKEVMTDTTNTNVVPVKEEVSFKNVIVINIFFWIYCIVQAAVIKLIAGEFTGVAFFIGIIGVGFTIVSLYDFIYTKLPKNSAD